MFGDLNRAQVLGNMTKDPELRHTGSGTPVTSFGLATNRRYLSNEEWKEDTTFHNIVVWGDRAERFVERAKKGTRLYVEGRITTRSWEDANGNKQYRTEIIAEKMILIDRYVKGPSAEVPKAPENKTEEKKSVKKTEENGDETIDPDELPF